ncbi:MAG: PIG-L deacetylase family protein [Hyphomicrobiaceae bacterium]
MLLFLLAHQDDELMVAPLILAAKRNGERIGVVYLTDGGAGSVTPATRNAETRRALATLGVDVVREVWFLGERLGIPDRFCYEHLSSAHSALLALVRELPPITAIYTHAWEGGNPDHDAVHVVALGIGRALRIEQAVFQIPFYRATRRGPLPFRVFAPLAANGEVMWYPVSRVQRLRLLDLIRFFPSQVQAFVRLGPFMLIDALWRNGLPVQHASLARILQRPMPEPLRYERHGHDRFDRILPYIEMYRRSTLDAPSTSLGPALAPDVEAAPRVAGHTMARTT